MSNRKTFYSVISDIIFLTQHVDSKTNELVKNIFGIVLIVLSLIFFLFKKRLVDNFLERAEKAGDRFYKKEYHEMYKARAWLIIIGAFLTGLWMLLFLGK